MAYLPKNITLCNRNFDIAIKRHPRSRRITMRIHPIHDRVDITAPKRLSNERIMAFLQSNHKHLEDYSKKLPEPVHLHYDATIPIFGESHIICREPQTKQSLIILSTDAKVTAHTARKLNALLTEFTHEVIDELWQLAPFASLTRPTKLSLRDPSSRWGSCSSDGRIMLSRRLIFAPEYVARYVIIHECCHLIHMNHSTDFWALCEQFAPESKRASAWLKKNYRELFRYQL